MAVGIVLLLLSPGSGCRSPFERSTPVEFELKLDRTRFITGASVNVELRLTNTGSEPIDAPHLINEANDFPVYTLIGPEHPEGVRFTFRSITQSKDLPPATAPYLKRLGPGQSFLDGFRLEEWIPDLKPGAYTLQARLEGEGWEATSEPARFVLEPTEFLSATPALDVQADRDLPFRIEWLGRCDSGVFLGESFFVEERKEGVLKRWGGRCVFPVGASASEPFAPWTTFHRARLAAGWHGWKEGKDLLMLPMGADRPFRLDLGSVQARLVRPAWMLPSKDQDVLTLSGDGRLLHLHRLPHPVTGHDWSPRLKTWSLELPGPALSARSAARDFGSHSVRSCAVLMQKDLSLLVGLIEARGEEAGRLRETIEIPHARALGDSQPAILIDEQGRTHVSVLYRPGSGASGARVLDAVFPADPTGTPTSESSLLPEPGPVARGALHLSDEGSRLRRDWVLLREDGILVLRNATIRPHRLPAPPALPLEILRFQSSYLLLLDPRSGPALHRLQ